MNMLQFLFGRAVRARRPRAGESSPPIGSATHRTARTPAVKRNATIHGLTPLRAFNAPNPAEATFYADSDVVEVRSNDTAVAFTFGAMRALDPADDDGDGLENSWEQLLGTDDRLTSDYDGDGMSDLHEWLAGTDLDDPDSKLSFRAVRSEESAQMRGADGEPLRVVRVTWQSVPGKKYRLEYVPMLGVDDPATGRPYAFSADLDGDGFDDDVIVAGENEYEIDVWVGVSTNAAGTFRVKLVTD